MPIRGKITITSGHRQPPGGDMEQLVSASVAAPRGSFGAFLRARRHRALLSQEQLAARAELSERTVRDLEAGPPAPGLGLLPAGRRLDPPPPASAHEGARAAGGQLLSGALPGHRHHRLRSRRPYPAAGQPRLAGRMAPEPPGHGTGKRA